MSATFDLFIEEMRKEIRMLGLEELRTPDEVDKAIMSSKGTLLVFVNSTCGCAGGIAKPALTMALGEKTVPDKLTTVFAGQDREATERARSYFTNEPPSSPSFALFKDGKFINIIHRSEIERRSPEKVAEQLKSTFEAYCRE